MNILVIETHSGSGDIVAHMVRRLGYEVTHIDPQQPILDYLKKQSFDLILIDCEPLESDMIVQAIRDQEQRHRQLPIPIIVLTTALSSKAYQVELCIRECIVKPLHSNTLKNILTRWTSVCTVKNKIPEPILDQQLLRQLNETMGQEIALLLVQQFMEYAPEQLVELRQMALAGDVVALRGKAHQLKGESLQMGAMQVGALCHQLETLTQAGQLNLILDCLAQLETAVIQANCALSQVSHND
ncbi:MAG: response regulator [Pseudomonadota bacterium]|nr:response regulator [Pseudomonadota bacterium]